MAQALKRLDTESMGSTRFREPRAFSSALAALGTLQPRALGSQNRVDPWTSRLTYIEMPSCIGCWGGRGQSQRVALPLHREMAHL